jgi:formate/nitrite transporter FocA (FNT family)
MSYKVKALLIGMVAGAALGGAFAWVASEGDKLDERGQPAGLAALGPGDYFQLGISILTLARQFGTMLKKQ